MDFQKLFVTVSHDILLQKLCYYRIRGSTHSLIKSYLTDRKQHVTNNYYNSTQKLIEIGVPQGSIMGLFFYLFYVNDISNALPCIPRLFMMILV